jgi:FkbM family methyltransferase
MRGVLRRLLPRTIRPRRILAGPLRGVWLVTSWHDYSGGLTGRTERALLDWFGEHARTGETWLDVGAHYGYTGFALARLVGAGGRVFTFEPVAATAGYMDRGRELNGLTQITIVPLGLGAPETLEIRRLPLTRGMADSTLPTCGRTQFVTIPIARFDWAWPLLHNGDAAVHGIKIDVQGMELEVLTGMQETLRRWHPRLVIELHTGVNRAAVLALLRDVGYSTSATAVEPAVDERTPLLLDDRSYAFTPI